MISAYGDVQDVVQAMKLGADDYVQKPYDLDEMVRCVTQTLHASRMREALDPAVRRRGASVRVSPASSGTVRRHRGCSRDHLEDRPVGGADRPRARGDRDGQGARGPCAALRVGSGRSAVREVELFRDSRFAVRVRAVRSRAGHVHGCAGVAARARRDRRQAARSFWTRSGTPARRRRRSSSPSSKSVFRRLGAAVRTSRWTCESSRPRTRISTWRASRGTFRKDLLHRLKVIGINLPSLREREGDVTVLAHHFVEEFNAQARKSRT